MLTACSGDGAKVNEFTKLFGEVFHEYVHDLWQRISGRRRTHKLTWGSGQDELGDGIVETASGIIIYDAKSRRPTLQVTRSGDLEAFFEDLEKGVLKGAGQLDAAIKKMRTGGSTDAAYRLDTSRIFPLIVTARHFPEVPFVYERIDHILDSQDLLKEEGVAPLLVIDAQTLEIMESLKESGDDPLDLLIQKALTPEKRTRSLEVLVYEERGSLPWPSRLREAFGRIGDCALGWLRSGRIDEETVDGVLYPQIEDPE
jgi:hypothetical protein